jgi:hypothetical protein
VALPADVVARHLESVAGSQTVTTEKVVEVQEAPSTFTVVLPSQQEQESKEEEVVADVEEGGQVQVLQQTTTTTATSTAQYSDIHPDDLWYIHGQAYDLRDFINKHPGKARTWRGSCFEHGGSGRVSGLRAVFLVASATHLCRYVCPFV